jgi:hypothetical protein
MDELPANKRSLYRRRYAMLEELGSTIAGQLRTPESIVTRPHKRVTDAHASGTTRSVSATSAEPGLLPTPTV